MAAEDEIGEHGGAPCMTRGGHDRGDGLAAGRGATGVGERVKPAEGPDHAAFVGRLSGMSGFLLVRRKRGAVTAAS